MDSKLKWHAWHWISNYHFWSILNFQFALAVGISSYFAHAGSLDICLIPAMLKLLGTACYCQLQIRGWNNQWGPFAWYACVLWVLWPKQSSFFTGDDLIALAPFVLCVLFLLYAVVKLFLPGRRPDPPVCNPDIKKDNPKVVDLVEIEDLDKDKVSYCRCWRSSKVNCPLIPQGFCFNIHTWWATISAPPAVSYGVIWLMFCGLLPVENGSSWASILVVCLRMECEKNIMFFLMMDCFHSVSFALDRW